MAVPADTRYYTTINGRPVQVSGASFPHNRALPAVAGSYEIPGPAGDRTFTGPGTFNDPKKPPPPQPPLWRRWYDGAYRKAMAFSEWSIGKLAERIEGRNAKRSLWPGETMHDYNFNVVAKQARRHGATLAIAGVILLFLLFAYLSLDALWLHNHGLVVVSVGSQLHERTLAARRALNASELLVVFQNDTDLRPARDFPKYQNVENCADVDTLLLLERARRYLTANEGRERCCCAPMFGVDANFIALYRDDDQPLYMFNADDRSRGDYDALSSESRTAEQLHVVTHSQAALFASAPEPVRILRRGRLSLDCMQHVGTMKYVEVRAEDAFCVDECLDLIRGISAVQRAAMQKAKGINV